jgi:hypothetical protein
VSAKRGKRELIVDKFCLIYIARKIKLYLQNSTEFILNQTRYTVQQTTELNFSSSLVAA